MARRAPGKRRKNAGKATCISRRASAWPRAQVRAKAEGQVRLSRPEPGTIGVRNAEELADHQRQDGQREGLDEVDVGSGRGTVVDCMADHLFDNHAQYSVDQRRECSLQCLAIPGVIRSVHTIEHAGDAALHVAVLDEQRQVEEIGAKVGIGQYLAH
jgi:hypothetical protein